MKIGKRGNSLAFRLPAKLVRELEIKAGDDYDVVVEGGAMVVQFKGKPELVTTRA